MSSAMRGRALAPLFVFLGFASVILAQASDDEAVKVDPNALASCSSLAPEAQAECARRLAGQPGVRRPAGAPAIPAPGLLTADQQKSLPAPPAEPPSDFQRFAEAAVGEMLPIYGAALFSSVPSTFAPVTHVPVNPEYTLGPGDEIQLRVWGQVNLAQTMVVDRTGDIFLPQAGRINLTGVRFGDLREVVKSALGRVYRNFDLNVNLAQLRSMQVFVVGHARRPGAYTISSLSTLLNALFACGGPSPGGSMRKIQLRRAGKRVTTLDLYELLLGGDKTQDAALESGDVIYIEARGPQVALAGSVMNPAIYEIANGSSLGALLDFAGGLSPVAATGEAFLERVPLHGQTLDSVHVALNEQGLATPLRNGDMIRLLPLVPRFDHSVTLRGNVADPVRFPWRAGMKISDVIPNRAALLTRDYWTEHNRMLQKVQEHRDVETEGGDLSAGGLVSAGHSAEIRLFATRNSVQPAAPAINWNYAAIERTDPVTLDTRLIAFNLAKVVVEHDPAADLALQPGDIITIFSEADFLSPLAEQSKFIRLEGEIKMAGVYSVRAGDTLRDLVARAGGLTDNAYLYGAEFTRESTRREQQKRYNAYLDQLERDLDQASATASSRAISNDAQAAALLGFQQQRQALQQLRKLPASGRIVLEMKPAARSVDSLPALALENGDRLIVPATPSTVSVMGTVFNPAAFLFNNNTSVSEYLREAGGATRFADKGYMFILRADGSVVSASSHGGMFKGAFESLRMFPGDALMVPSNVTKVSRMRSFVEWSQVLSGFGLAAAAINVLR